MTDLSHYCTERQLEILEAIERHGGNLTAAAKELSISRSTVRSAVKYVREKAAKKGYSPEHGLTEPIAHGQILRGYTNRYKVDDKGNKTLIDQYVKTKYDEAEVKEAMEVFAKEFYSDLPPLKNIPKITRKRDQDIIPWINIGDAHIGMVSYKAETGQSFDLSIAKRELCKAFDIAMAQLPECERIVINDLGDGTHYENFSGVTENSGHALDCDGRFPRMIQTYSFVMRYAIDRALTKAKYVDVIINQGNHSRTNDIWMRELIDVSYRTERVTALKNESVTIPYRMGNTFVMVHHSDKMKPDRLSKVMATDYAQDWGEAEYRYIDIGHIHHNMISKEHPGVHIESYNQLAPADAYAHNGGWRSRSSLTIQERSKTYGNTRKHTIPVEMIKDIIDRVPPGTSIKRRKVYTV